MFIQKTIVLGYSPFVSSPELNHAHQEAHNRRHSAFTGCADDIGPTWQIVRQRAFLAILRGNLLGLKRTFQPKKEFQHTKEFYHEKLLIIIWVTFGLNTSIIAGPIHDAAGAKDLDEIKSLIEIGVSVDHRDKNDLTALMISIAQNDFETADFLVSVGADVNAKTKKVQDAYGGPEAGWETIIYFDSHHLIYMDDNSRGRDRDLLIITKLT